MGARRSSPCWMPRVAQAMRRARREPRGALMAGESIDQFAPVQVVILRRVALFLGHQLGWDSEDVALLGEALAGRPWRELGVAELDMLCGEYLALLEAIAEKRRARWRGPDVGGSQAIRDAVPGAWRDVKHPCPV